VFNLVFVLDPSSKSTSAQNESCRSSFSLQLLFWPNFKFLYENLSFNWSNSSKNHLNEETVHLLCSTLCRPDAIPASGRRRTTPRVGNRAPTPLFTLHWPGSFRSVHPYPFPELLRRARARVAAVRRAGHGSPPRLDSLRPEPSSLAVHRLHSTPCPFEPNPGRIERFRRDRHCCSSRTPPHAVELPLRGLLRPNQAQDAANAAFHELVAEPVQEPRAEELQQVAVEHAPEDFVNPADLQGMPRSITII